MQRVSLIALFDEFSLPLRYASSLMQNDGHIVTMTFLHGLGYVGGKNIPQPEEGQEGGYFGCISWITAKEETLLLDSLKKQDPAFVGIHVSPAHFGLAAYVTRRIREALKKPVVWSGVDPTLSPDVALEHADSIIVGECEDAYRDIANTFDKNGDLTQIANVWTKKDGQLYKNEKRTSKENLDEYPFADFEPGYKSVICGDEISSGPFPPQSPLHTNLVMRATRGCPYSPSYYFHGLDDAVYAGDTRVRRRSVKNVIDEIKYRAKRWQAPLQRVEFYDPSLPMDRAWTEEFAEEFGSEIGLRFSGYVHPNFMDSESLPKLFYYGLDYLILGIQSGSANTIEKYYGGRPTRDEIIHCANQIQNAGMKLVVETVGGNPLESEDDYKETLNLVMDIPKPYGMKPVLPMAFLDGFSITKTALDAGIGDQLERPEGVHGYQKINTPQDLFWEMIFMMGHLNNFTKEYVLNFTQDEYMKGHPEIFQEYVQIMYNATYYDGNPLLDKDDYVGHLRWKVSQIERSPVYRAYHKVKSLVR